MGFRGGCSSSQATYKAPCSCRKIASRPSKVTSQKPPPRHRAYCASSRGLSSGVRGLSSVVSGLVLIGDSLVVSGQWSAFIRFLLSTFCFSLVFSSQLPSTHIGLHRVKPPLHPVKPAERLRRLRPLTPWKCDEPALTSRPPCRTPSPHPMGRGLGGGASHQFLGRHQPRRAAQQR